MIKIHCKYDALVNPKELKVNPKNPNSHSKAQIDRLAKILNYQGWRYPIKVSKQSGLITSGHGRVLSAIKLNQETVPVNYQDYDSTEMEYSDVVSDNAIAEWSELDLSSINEVIPDLGPDFDIDFLGIEDFVIEPADKYSEESEDDVPEEPKAAISKLGDLYQLGEHRLLCGDATKDVDKLLSHKCVHCHGGGCASCDKTGFHKEKVDLVFTDPPYDISGGGKHDSSYDVDVINSSQYKDWDKGFDYTTFMPVIPGLIKKDGNIFIFSSSFNCWQSLLPFFYNKFDICTMFIWAKKFAISNVRQVGFAKSFEPAIYAWNKGHIFNPKKGLENYDVQFFSSNEGGRSYEHPTSKPVALCQHIIEILSNQTVLDLFGGSGSTLIACEKTNRKCFMMEIEPKYIDVIVSRWCKYTGNDKVFKNGEEIIWEKLVDHE